MVLKHFSLGSQGDFHLNYLPLNVHLLTVPSALAHAMDNAIKVFFQNHILLTTRLQACFY
jgi:hypothetical protein